MQFRSRRDGSHYPLGRRKRSLFNAPPSHPRLAAEISIVNPTQARESVHKLNEHLKDNGSRRERVLLVRAASQAANRAKVASQNMRLSEDERGQMREISEIYRGFVDAHKVGKKGADPPQQNVSPQLLEKAEAKRIRVRREIERTKDAPIPTRAQKSLPPSEFYRETRAYQEKLFWQQELKNVEKAEENYKKSPTNKNAQILEYSISS